MTDRAAPSGRRFGPALLVVAVAAALAGSTAWLFLSRSGGAIDPADRAQVALGARIYAEHCASCHGANLEGQPDWRTRKPDGRLPAPPHDATGHTWHHPDEHLVRVTRDGIKPPLVPEGYASDMPGFAGVLSDDEIRAVLAYIKSTWPPRIRERQESINERARE